MLPDDGVYNVTSWRCFNVNFNTPFTATLYQKTLLHETESIIFVTENYLVSGVYMRVEKQRFLGRQCSGALSRMATILDMQECHYDFSSHISSDVIEYVPSTLCTLLRIKRSADRIIRGQIS
jgi:hypothetical protein